MSTLKRLGCGRAAWLPAIPPDLSKTGVSGGVWSPGSVGRAVAEAPAGPRKREPVAARRFQKPEWTKMRDDCARGSLVVAAVGVAGSDGGDGRNRGAFCAVMRGLTGEAGGSESLGAEGKGTRLEGAVRRVPETKNVDPRAGASYGIGSGASPRKRSY